MSVRLCFKSRADDQLKRQVGPASQESSMTTYPPKLSCVPRKSYRARFSQVHSFQALSRQMPVDFHIECDDDAGRTGQKACCDIVAARCISLGSESVFGLTVGGRHVCIRTHCQGHPARASTLCHAPSCRFANNAQPQVQLDLTTSLQPLVPAFLAHSVGRARLLRGHHL